MSKEELLAEIFACKDKVALARVADALHNNNPQITEAEARLVTYIEAGKRLGVSATTCRRLAKDGQITVVNVRGKNRVSLASVLKYAGV